MGITTQTGIEKIEYYNERVSAGGEGLWNIIKTVANSIIRTSVPYFVNTLRSE